MSETPRLHQSLASILINQSPLHCFHKAFRQEIEEWDEARNLGTLCHKLLLGGKDIVVVDAKDWRTNASKEARDAAIADGKIPVLTQKLAIAHTLKDKVLAELERRRIHLSGESELNLKWNSPGGVACEGRLDHFNKGMIWDFKFVNSAAKKTCEASFLNYGYDIQHAAYVQSIETTYPELAGRVRMDFIFVEVDAPHALRVMPVGGTMRTSGQWRWAKACETWQLCLDKYGTDKPWPAYDDDNEPAELPAWALNAQIAEAEISERMISNAISG